MEDISTELDIRDERWIEIKSLRMTPWETQQAVVVLAASTVPRGRPSIRVKTGLKIVTARVLPNVVRCFKCHMVGHNVARCTVVSPGKKLCRRCGDRDHTINQCTKKPRCAICAKENRSNLKHVKACPAAKDRMRGNIHTLR